jgi:hypothetical protein
LLTDGSKRFSSFGRLARRDVLLGELRDLVRDYPDDAMREVPLRGLLQNS